MVKEFSQIASGGAVNTSTDEILAVRGTTDYVVALGSAAAENTSAVAQTANNLSDLTSASTARTNLGLGTAATQNTGSSGANVPLLNASNAWSGQQYFAQATLTDGATITWNLNTQQCATVTLAGNRTLANPTNAQAGSTYVLEVIQDGTGSRTLAYGSNYKWPGATAPTLSTAAGAIDLLTFYYDGNSMLGVAQKAFG